jgi:uncharacterized protein DUF3310
MPTIEQIVEHAREEERERARQIIRDNAHAISWQEIASKICKKEVSIMKDLTPEVDKLLGLDRINHPSHYGGDTTYEAIKVIEAWELGFCLGNAVKYICRFGRKDDRREPIEDLKKAVWYIQREIQRLEKLDKGAGR